MARFAHLAALDSSPIFCRSRRMITRAHNAHHFLDFGTDEQQRHALARAADRSSAAISRLGARRRCRASARRESTALATKPASARGCTSADCRRRAGGSAFPRRWSRCCSAAMYCSASRFCRRHESGRHQPRRACSAMTMFSRIDRSGRMPAALRSSGQNANPRAIASRGVADAAELAIDGDLCRWSCLFDAEQQPAVSVRPEPSSPARPDDFAVANRQIQRLDRVARPRPLASTNGSSAASAEAAGGVASIGFEFLEHLAQPSAPPVPIAADLWPVIRRRAFRCAAP